jgi:transcriptional regulator with XRE-family HTH domain
MEAKKRLPLIDLGVRVSTLQKQRGITLERLAYEVGICKGSPSGIENKKRVPRLSTLTSVTRGLGISVSQFLKGF